VERVFESDCIYLVCVSASICITLSLVACNSEIAGSKDKNTHVMFIIYFFLSLVQSICFNFILFIPLSHSSDYLNTLSLCPLFSTTLSCRSVQGELELVLRMSLLVLGSGESVYGDPHQ
jgi:ABC-type Na+ efflux pump permease subunit